MRIAFHVPRASWLEPEFSGDQAVLYGLLAGLDKRGHQVRITSRLDALDICRGRVPARRLVSEALSIWTEMKRFSPDVWLVYTPSVTYPDLFGWWHRARRYAIFAADSGRPERLPRHLRWLYSFSHRRSLKRADKVSAYRPHALARLLALGVTQERLCVLPPPVKIWDWLPSREEARRHLGLSDTAPVVLCVSRFTLQRKDGRAGKTGMLIDLLTAVAQLPPDVILVLVGDGHGRPQVEAEAARLKLDGRVWLAGQVTDVRWFYAACDVFAYPYGLDRPWVSVLEAQACGRPVVTMRTESSNLTVQDGRTGLLVGDLDEFQAQLAALLNDRARCLEMGRAAREYVTKCHSLETRIQQIEDLLLDVPPASAVVRGNGHTQLENR